MWAGDEVGVIVAPATAAHGAGTLRRRHSGEPKLQRDACWVYVAPDELDSSEDTLILHGHGSALKSLSGIGSGLRRLQSAPGAADASCSSDCNDPPPSGPITTSEAERKLNKTGSGWLRNLGNAWNTSLGEVKWNSISAAALSADAAIMAKASDTSPTAATAAAAASTFATAANSSSSTFTAAGAADGDEDGSSASSGAAPLGNVTNVSNTAKLAATLGNAMRPFKPKKCSKKE